MLNRIFNLIILIFILIIFQNCDDEWIFDIPGCSDQNATNYDSNATADNGSCYYGEEIDIINIDASSYDDWVYFSFELGDILDISNPGSSMDWDIAFKRNHVKTNGGLSGVGNACAIVDDTQSWINESFESTEQITDGECQVDELIEGNIITYQGCYDPNTHLFTDCVKNPALDNWGSFDSSYHFIINNYRFFVKRADGDYVKFWLMSYYNLNGESGYISIAYQTILVNE